MRPVLSMPVVALVALGPVNAAAQTEAPEQRVELTPTASAFTRYELRRGYDDLGVARPRFQDSDAVAYRARVGLKLGPIEIADRAAVSVQFTPQASGFYGMLPGTVADADAGVHEGYLRVLLPGWQFDAGRFVMNYGDALVIGSLDWHQTGRSFDGLRAAVSLGQPEARVDAFVTLVNEGFPIRPTPFAAGDHYFSGIYAAFGPLFAEKLEFDAYVLNQTWTFTPDVPVDPNNPDSGIADRESASQFTFGLRAKQRVGPVDYRVESGVQLGTAPAAPGVDSPDTAAYQIDGEIGLNLWKDKLRPWVGGFFATGDDPTTIDDEGWDQLYPTGHKWLGLSDIIGPRTNIVGPKGGLGLRPAADLAFGVDAHVFIRPQTPENTASYAGSELDFLASYSIGRGLKLSGLYALFLSNEDHFGSGEHGHYGELQLRYDLK